MDRSKIVEIARNKLGLKYSHQGRNADIALDCVGLVTHICDELSIDYEGRSDYPRTPYDNQLIKALDSQPFLRKIKEVENGCIIVMRIRKQPQHTAIYSQESNTIIHACAIAGRVVEQTYTDHFKIRSKRFYRIII